MQLFFVFLLAILAYSDMPPGRRIHNALNIATTDYSVFAIPATTIAIAVFDSVICCMIARLVFSVAERAAKAASNTAAIATVPVVHTTPASLTYHRTSFKSLTARAFFR